MSTVERERRVQPGGRSIVSGGTGGRWMRSTRGDLSRPLLRKKGVVEESGRPQAGGRTGLSGGVVVVSWALSRPCRKKPRVR